MSKNPERNIKGRFSVSVPREADFLRRRREYKSKTIKNEEPDKLINSISNVSHPEKLLNVRKNKRRMTHLEKNIDLPDNLLAIDEFKKTNIPRHTHVSRTFRASCLNPDLPDFLEPIEEIITSNLEKPHEKKEEEKKNNFIKKVSFSSSNSKESNNKSEKSDINIEKEMDKLEQKRKEIEEEKRKLNEEKKLMEEKRKLDEEEKKIKEEKILEEKNKIKLEYEK